MAVNKIGEKYRCNICGNEVVVTKVAEEALFAVVKIWKKSKDRRI
jgi:hypothetical protein